MNPLCIYPTHPWVDPRVIVRASPVEGLGLFALEPIAAGEVVIRWGGSLFTPADVAAGLPRPRSLGVIGPALYIGSLPDAPDWPDEFMNHACSPNLWMDDEVTFSALRDIAPGEEVTCDYALFEHDPGWSMRCLCGSIGCRGRIAGDDWRLPALQRRYAGHFSPYLLERIARLRDVAPEPPAEPADRPDDRRPPPREMTLYPSRRSG